MSLYQREGSPFWWYSISVDGRRLRGSTGETEKRDAKLAEAKIRFEASQRRGLDDQWRVRDAFGAYWNDRAKSLRSAGDVFRKLEYLSDHLGRDLPIDQVTDAAILDYRAKRRGHGVQPHSVNRDISVLQAALNHAHKIYKKALPNIAWSEIKVSEPPHRTRFLSYAEFGSLLDAAHPELRPILHTAVATGLRKGNLLQLRWDDVDLAAGRITVTVKGGKRHQVKMPAALRAIFGTLGERKGRVFETTNFRKRWYAAVKASKLEGLRFHDLRHTFASWARMAGADIADICEALAHSDISVTMRYAHIRPDEHVTAFDRVADKLWSQPPSQSKAN